MSSDAISPTIYYNLIYTIQTFVITNTMDVNLGRPREVVWDREAWHAAAHVVANDMTGQLNNATIFIKNQFQCLF